jgi:hypothetical protein
VDGVEVLAVGIKGDRDGHAWASYGSIADARC